MDNPSFTVLKSIRDELAATLTPEEFAALLSTQATDGPVPVKRDFTAEHWPDSPTLPPMRRAAHDELS